jgi:MFS family permease
VSEVESLAPAQVARSDAARVVGVSFVAQFMTAGLTSYIFGLFVIPVTGELGISRGALSAAIPLQIATAALLAPLVGRVVDARPVRRIMLAGALLVGGSLAALSTIGAAWQGGLLLLALAAGTALGGSLPASALLVRTLPHSQRLALGLASVGTSAGGFALPPLAAKLIEQSGWRGALLWLGALGAAVLVASAWLGIPERADRAVRVDPARAFAWRTALGAPSFWLITGYMTLLLGTNVALLAHLPAFARDTGFTANQAAQLASALALSALLGKLVYSAVAERLDVRAPLWLAGVVQAPALALLLAEPSYPVLLATAAINGLGTGAVLPAWSALVARCFDPAAFARVLGLSRLCATPVMSASAVLAGWIHDTTGGYEPAFQVFLASSLVAAALPFLIRVPRRI